MQDSAYSTLSCMTICADCGRDRPIRARALCGSCYNRAAKRRRDTGEDMPSKVNLSAAEHLQLSKADPGQCWPWHGQTDVRGYGHASLPTGRDYAHRYAYRELVGELDEGMTVDHLCRVRSCVNPDHLEQVTRGENLRRAVGYRRPQKKRLGRCEHGDSDVYYDPKEKRVCRICRRERTRLWRDDPGSAHRVN